MVEKCVGKEKTTKAWCADCHRHVTIRASSVFKVNKKDPYAPNTSHGFQCPHCGHVNYTLTYGNLDDLGVS